jgi:peroxiredoxin Q/BCP
VKLPDGKEVSVERGATAARWTFVVGKDGKVIYRNQSVKPDGHARELVALLKKFNRKK